MSAIQLKRLAVVALSALTFSLPMLTVGCERKGPAEKAGENIDRAGERAQDSIHDAARDVEHGTAK